jgi:protein-disulfide isomerase
MAFDASEKAEIGKVVREYLLAHPELMLEVQDALEKKQADEQRARSKDAIAQNKADIFDAAHDLVLGNPKGDVTVVEFFDYNCGYCKHAVADMDTILADDGNVRFVLKEFPILGPDSVAAHRVSMAFRLIAPEKYGDFQKALLGGTVRATEARALEIAAKLGVSEKTIRARLDDPTIEASVKQSYDLANKLGITGTPSYVVGDETVFGALGSDVLKEKIDNVRRCASTVC